MKSSDNPIIKMAYSAPVLQTYGNIRAITLATSGTGMGDGAKAGSAKT